MKTSAVLRVLRHPAMLRLWLAQVIYLSVQFTASYGMIVLVTEETGSATLVGVLIITLSLPIVLLGAPAGTLVDRFDRRTVLWVSNAVRAIATALFVLVLVAAPHAGYSIFFLAFLFSLVGLFFTPAEAAIIPTLVDEDELLPALSLYNLTLNISQVFGLLILGPLALNILPQMRFLQVTFTPVEMLFTGVTALYLLAALLTFGLPRGRAAAQPVTPLPGPNGELVGEGSPIPFVHEPAALGMGAAWERMRVDLREGWQIVRRDGILAESLFQACFGGLIMLTVAQLATIFMKRLLHLDVSYTALVFAPAGIGLIVGGVMVPTLVKWLGMIRTVIVGMSGAAIAFALLPLAQVLEPPHLPVAYPFQLVVVALTVMIGFSLNLVIVPAQTRVQEHSPDEMRGRIQALYQVLFNGGSIPVALFMGSFTDIFGIVPVLFVLAAVNLLAIFLTVTAESRHDKGSAPDARSFAPIPDDDGQPQSTPAQMVDTLSGPNIVP